MDRDIMQAIFKGDVEKFDVLVHEHSVKLDAAVSLISGIFCIERWCRCHSRQGDGAPFDCTRRAGRCQ